MDETSPLPGQLEAWEDCMTWWKIALGKPAFVNTGGLSAGKGSDSQKSF